MEVANDLKVDWQVRLTPCIQNPLGTKPTLCSPNKKGNNYENESHNTLVTLSTPQLLGSMVQREFPLHCDLLPPNFQDSTLGSAKAESWRDLSIIHLRCSK